MLQVCFCWPSEGQLFIELHHPALATCMEKSSGGRSVAFTAALHQLLLGELL